jgi:hypothetical protein
MTRRIIHGVFQREEDLAQALADAGRMGWSIVDIYTPYPVHAAFESLGLARSRLPRAAFVYGLCGVGLAFWFQFWVSASDWPLNVGGRPWNSLPAFVPVAFEMMVLCAGLGVVLTWLLLSRLYPGKKAMLASPRATDDAFVLAVQCADQDQDAELIRRRLQECHAIAVEERETL